MKKKEENDEANPGYFISFLFSRFSSLCFQNFNLATIHFKPNWEGFNAEMMVQFFSFSFQQISRPTFCLD